MNHPDPRVQRVIALFESLAADDTARLDAFYAPDASFKDPFHEVRGVAAIRAVFDRMFETLVEPAFVVHDAIAEGDRAFLAWDFRFRMKRFVRAPITVRGGTSLRFAADGRIAEHRDWWDAAEELYAKLPLIGALVRALARRVREG